MPWLYMKNDSIRTRLDSIHVRRVYFFKAWITKDYTEVSPKVIVCLVGAIIYLIKKKDLISDNIPVIGIADDLGVMGLALKLCEPELKAFAEWRAAKNAVQG